MWFGYGCIYGGTVMISVYLIPLLPFLNSPNRNQNQTQNQPQVQRPTNSLPPSLLFYFLCFLFSSSPPSLRRSSESQSQSQSSLPFPSLPSPQNNKKGGGKAWKGPTDSFC